jgi:aspartyl-tRNA(Asn)/glutamyl-tRNA(Gln) amidotransferase subunit B
MRSPAEAGAYVRKLRAILRYVGSCDGNMEEGSMRADVNVSVRRPGGELGTRTETKNVNSVRFVMAAIEHEAKRQVDVIEERRHGRPGNPAVRPRPGQTRSMRSKEDAHDYRYFPDPDLLPLELDDAFIEECRASLPELPDAKRKRYESLGITPYNAKRAHRRCRDRPLVRRAARQRGRAEGQAAANWTVSEYFGALNRLGDLTVGESPVSPAQAASC